MLGACSVFDTINKARNCLETVTGRPLPETKWFCLSIFVLNSRDPGWMPPVETAEFFQGIERRTVFRPGSRLPNPPYTCESIDHELCQNERKLMEYFLV